MQNQSTTSMPLYRHSYQTRIKHVSGEAKQLHQNAGAIRTMAEVAEILGISRQAVHQVERSALYKLRCAFQSEIAERNPAFYQAVVAQQQQQLRQ